VVAAWLLLPGLSTIRAAAAGHSFQTLDFLAHGFVEDGVGQEDKPVGAGVGVVILTGLPWTEYARLCGVHSSVPTFLWAGLRGALTPAGPFLYPTPQVYRMFTAYAPSVYRLW